MTEGIRYKFEDVMESLEPSIGRRILIQENPTKYAYFGSVKDIEAFTFGNSPRICFFGSVLMYDSSLRGWVKNKLRSHYVSRTDLIWEIENFEKDDILSVPIPLDVNKFRNSNPDSPIKLVYPPSTVE